MNELLNFAPPTSALESNALEALTAFEMQLLASVEQHWWTKRKLLSKEQLVELFGPEAAHVFEKPAFIHALRTKGIFRDQLVDGQLTAKQVLAANMILTRADTRSMREKLKEVGVTISQWNGWMATKEFASYVSARSGIDFASGDHIAFASVLASVEQGDMQATKLYLEMRGLYQNKIQVEINVSLLLSQIVDVIAQYIPEEFMEVAADAIERIYNVHSGGPQNIIEASAITQPALEPEHAPI